MNLLFVKTRGTDIPFYYEVLFAKVGIILGADKVTIVSYNFLDNIKGGNIEKLTLKEYVEKFMTIFKDNPNAMSKEDMTTHYKYFMSLKAKKAKDKGELIHYMQLDKFFNDVKKDVISVYNNMTNQEEIRPMIPFYNEGIVELIHYDPENIEPIEMLPDLLLRHLINDDAIHVFDVSMLYGQKGWLRKYGTIEDENDERTILGNFHVLSFPDLNSFSTAQLQLIRNDFKAKLQPYNDALANAITEFGDLLYIQENDDFIERRVDEILNMPTDIANETAKSNIYFQQAINSVKAVQMYRLHLGFAPIKMLIGFYKNRALITEAEEAYILNCYARHKSIETVTFLYYITPILPETEK